MRSSGSGDAADADLRLRKFGVRRRYSDVAGESELHTAGERVAVHGANDRFVDIDLGERVISLQSPERELGEAAAAEGFAFAALKGVAWVIEDGDSAAAWRSMPGTNPAIPRSISPCRNSGRARSAG